MHIYVKNNENITAPLQIRRGIANIKKDIPLQYAYLTYVYRIHI
jgi:hypothetical protein